MTDKKVIVALVVASLVTVATGQDRNEKGNQTIRSILAMPAVDTFPGSPALQEIERRTNLLAVLCQNWTTAETSEEKVRLLDLAVYYGRCQFNTNSSHYRLFDELVAKALVEALDDEDRAVRSTAADLLQMHLDAGMVRKLGPQIVEAVMRRKNTAAILLLGRTGMKEAEGLLKDEKAFRATSERKTELALARLGNKEYEANFVDEFKSAKTPGKKCYLAQDLAYVGTEKACKTLAEELRTPEKVEGAGLSSLRLFIIDALSMVYPNESVLRKPSPLALPKDDSYYEEIEKWAERKFNIVWSRPRPPFFYTMRTGRPSGSHQ